MVTLTIALTMNVVRFSHYTARSRHCNYSQLIHEIRTLLQQRLLLDFSQNNEHTK